MVSFCGNGPRGGEEASLATSKEANILTRVEYLRQHHEVDDFDEIFFCNSF